MAVQADAPRAAGRRRTRTLVLPGTADAAPDLVSDAAEEELGWDGGRRRRGGAWLTEAWLSAMPTGDDARVGNEPEGIIRM